MAKNTSKKYSRYFDIDENYFPQFNDSTAKEVGPNYWMDTYPHETFCEMLTALEKVLGRSEKRSLWVEGAYGTGKSLCAYTLKRILDVSEDDLRDYWSKYAPLKKKSDLLQKLIGHKGKDNGILTVYRYASGSINSPRDLFFAVQESVKTALVERNLSYQGENTLKESVIAWLEDVDKKPMFDRLLKNPDKEWKDLFSQSTADQVLSLLRKSTDPVKIKSLMDNIFRLADKEGITALNLNADRLIVWLTDVIHQNKLKIVLIWDEFSDYFKNNRESLSEFQRLAELVNTEPFYFIVVTHESGQLFTASDSTWKKVRDRFVTVNISLPDNIAFDLIGHAFKEKQAAKNDWYQMTDDLNSRLDKSRSAVMKAVNIDDVDVIKKLMPLHPMAALLLKNIASAFQSNQRSMFDFIKSSDMENVKAFQWFIENTGPEDDHPLLTVDMLWNFFYEKGKDNLSSDIRLILDVFPQQQELRKDEQAVLKAILIMQAIDQRLHGIIDLFKATDQHISYVFEGISSGSGLEAGAKNIAKGLKEKGILISTPISGGRHVYTAAVLAGDQTKIDNHKNTLRQTSKTPKLVLDGELSTVLSLPPALRLRFESEPGGGIMSVTLDDFTRKINELRDKPVDWHFNAVIAFAKDDDEAAALRKKMKEAAANKDFENIVFIDALSTPLGGEAFEQYVDYSALAMYYQGSNNQSSRDSTNKAKGILTDWKNRIYNGQLVVYSSANPEGEKFANAQGVASAIQTIVTSRFPSALEFDFARNISESQLKLTHAKSSAKCGIVQSTSGVVAGIEKSIISAVWKAEKYWENSLTSSLSISKIKTELNEHIERAFVNDGQISIGEIYKLLEETKGFAPCNMSAFLAGFLLKEYSGEPFRYSDSLGAHELMTPDKLSEMLGNYIGKSNPKATYIVKMTPEEMAFYELTEKVWQSLVPCTSVVQAVSVTTTKMRELGLPVWCLTEVDKHDVFDVVQKYIELVQKEGKEAHQKAVEIGKFALGKPANATKIASLISTENCQNGMREFLKAFEGGKILNLASDIGAEKHLLGDIRNLFEVNYACFWDRKTGENEIRKLLTDYGIVKETNSILNSSAHSLQEALTAWCDKLDFLNISSESLRKKYPSFAKCFDLMLRIYQHDNFLPEQYETFLAELSAHHSEIKELLDNNQRVFAEIYSSYLENLSDDDIAEIKSKLPTKIFGATSTESNAKVNDQAKEFRKNQIKSQLYRLWEEKTGTKSPHKWSDNFRTPILCCVSDQEFVTAKKAFETLNRNQGTDIELKAALEFLGETKLFDVLSDENVRNTAFERKIIGDYRPMLPDTNAVRESLEQLSISTYDWFDNPMVKKKVKQLAEAAYHAGGSDKVLQIIEKMNDKKLKQYLNGLVKTNMTFGIEILSSGEVTI